MEEINNREIHSYDILPIYKELIESGHELSITITGHSMDPFLVHGRDRLVLSKADASLKRGDMAFYVRPNGQYVMHRVKAVKKEGCYFVGDAQTEVEGPVDRQAVFARVTAVYRKGKRLSHGSFLWEIFEHLWLDILPIRHIIIKIYKWSRRNEKG